MATQPTVERNHGIRPNGGTPVTGIVGTIGSEPTLNTLLEPMYDESWYRTDSVSIGDSAIALRHHAEKDSAGWHLYREDGRCGVIHGAIANLNQFDGELSKLFDRLFEEPENTLSQLDGPFLIAATDSNQTLIATDKLGTRPCYYTAENTFAFGSNLASPLEAVSSPTVDTQAVSDMILMGQVWGEKTLVEEISALPPGSLLTYEDGSCSVSQYWTFDFDVSPKENPFSTIAPAYRTAMADITETMEGSIGLWLSGGLDSRAMGHELSRNVDSVVAYTYDANPSGGGNIEIARRLSERLNFSHQSVDLTPDRFVDVFSTSVSLTGGMISWLSFLNLTAVFNISDPTDIILEGCGQGTILGAGLGQSLLDRYDTPEEALYQAKHQSSRETVDRLLTPDIDPMATHRTAVAAIPDGDDTERALAAYFRNYVTRGDFASNRIARSQVGSRVPLAHGEFLDAATKLPLSYRSKTIPFTRGKIPAGTAKGKLELARELEENLSGIPYERTKVSPAAPHWLHVLGFVADTGFKRLRGKPAYGGRRLQSVWYHQNERLSSVIDGLLADAAERPLFDEDVLRELRLAHVDGEANNLGPLAAVTTLECWFQQHLD